jgi:cytochrome c553
MGRALRPAHLFVDSDKMRNSKTGVLVASLLAVASGSPIGTARAANPVPAKANMCANCHGEDGVAVEPGTANLAGQQKEYLVEQLRAFRSGRRQNPQMSVVAKSLTDEDINELSDWYSSIKITVTKPQ